ncbi:MAG: hypothetical protein KatS3mg129_1900 [Leptospiraceae bacterium]|nr:MAG: hypothetical protein KatS3mg129_1900 [Leptospiraceae bacterium]
MKTKFKYFLSGLLAFGLTMGLLGQNVSTEEKIKILENEIEQLKEKKATKQYKSFQGLGPAASGVYYVEDGLSWGGYGEIKYKNYKTPYKADSADVHRLILYAGYKFNDWIVLNSEIEYEHAGIEREKITFCEDVSAGQCEKETETIQQGEVYVEFAYIDFLFSDAFQIAAGLQLIPVGITNIYHEPTTFFSVERPYTESVIIPSTWRDIGIMAHGKLFNDLILYKVGVFNGMDATAFSDNEWIRGGRQKGSKVKAQDLAYVAAIDIYPLEGLTIGGSYYIGGSGNKDVEKVDVLSRIDWSVVLPGSDATTVALRNHVEKEFENSRKINPLIHLAEGHIKYEKDGIYFQSLIARGWIKEDDVRALNALTGKNIGSTVEGAYATIGYDIAPLFGWNKKFVVFYKNEYVNTQKKTLRDSSRIFFESLAALQSGGVLKTNFSDNSMTNSLNSTEIKTIYSNLGVVGAPNPVNDRRIQTIGFAFYPHPNVSIKVDYEDWSSKSNYYQDSDFYNQSNNNIDVINAAVTFIF